ncbi:hypothetical protein DPX16_6092 [Anabarilius grahami]|uniref:Uncharacterized protein n=1 Tax=Anabarilius grahami TaxID=495550 RepID=A0A3N0XWJ7_ANAGA|nr:hypothetical protein DPX16_6092 [Anabarilius grahami]
MGLTTAGCMAVTKQRVFYQRVIGARQRLDWNCRLLQRPLKYEEMLLNLIPCTAHVRCEKNGWEWLCLMIIELLDGDSKPLKEELLWRSRSKL